MCVTDPGERISMVTKNEVRFTVPGEPVGKGRLCTALREKDGTLAPVRLAHGAEALRHQAHLPRQAEAAGGHRGGLGQRLKTAVL